MKTTLAIIAGLAAGICVGLLIAPDKGSETRRRVAETTGDWAEKMMNMFNRGNQAEISKNRGPRSHRRTPGQPV